MTQETDVAALVDAWLTLPEVADILGVEVTRVRQAIRDGRLLAVREGEGQPLRVPTAFLQNGEILKGLVGTITLLRDAKYADDEALRWLFTSDDLIPGRPVDALVANRGKSVKRRAQVLGF